MRDLAVHIPTLLPFCLILLAFTLPFLTAFSNQGTAIMSRASHLKPAVGLGFAILAFIAVLLSYWASGRSHHVLVGSILPWNDAGGYFFGALHLLDSGKLTYWGERRPVYTALLAGFLSLSGRDLQFALLIQTVFTGAVAFFAARVAALRMGPPAGLLVFTLLFCFASEYAPTTMTEDAGFLFGTLGITILWLKAEQRSFAWFAAAGFLLTLGLLARAGAFFIIPLLLLWAWIAFRDDRGAALKCVLALLGGALLAVLLNQGIYWHVGTGSNFPFSNFSYTFYGLAVGGKGWLQIFADHPNIMEGGEGVAAPKMFAFAFEQIMENPLNIVVGYVKNLPYSTARLFDYAPPFLLLRRLFTLFWLVGLFVAFRRRREPLALLLLMATVGIILSGPFLSDVGSRVYAATISFDVYLAGLGFSTLIAWLSRTLKQKFPAWTAPPVLAAQLIGTGSALVLLTIAGSFLLPRSQASTLPAFACEAKETPAVLRLGNESPLFALRIQPPFALFPPVVRHGDFVSLIDRAVHLRETLKQLPPETAVIAGYARKESGAGDVTWMTWKTKRLPPRGSLVGFCLKPGTHHPLGAAFREPSRVQVLKQD